MKRNLQLRRETLAELATADLLVVRGAAPGTAIQCLTALNPCGITTETPAIINPPTDACPTFQCTGPTTR